MLEALCPIKKDRSFSEGVSLGIHKKRVEKTKISKQLSCALEKLESPQIFIVIYGNGKLSFAISSRSFNSRQLSLSFGLNSQAVLSTLLRSQRI